jgi:hypothetical protein
MTEEQENQLTFSLTQVMENWQLTDQEQIALLGLKSLKPRHLYLYRRGPCLCISTKFMFSSFIRLIPPTLCAI